MRRATHWSSASSEGPEHDRRQAWEFRYTRRLKTLKKSLKPGDPRIQVLRDNDRHTHYTVIFSDMCDQRMAEEWVKNIGGKLIVPPDVISELLGPH